MKYTWIGGMLLCVALGTSGCLISKAQYEATTAELESAKIELEKNLMLHDALDQKIQRLKSQNQKTTMDLEMMASEIQRIKESRENERTLLESRETAMGKRTKLLASRTAGLQRAYRKIKSQNRVLKGTIVRYRKELKEIRQNQAKNASRSLPSSTSQNLESQETTSVPAKLVTESEVVPVPAPLKGTLAPVNINAASANDLVLFLGLTKTIAEKVVSNRPYRLRGELVAKNVIPKATFDVIKDRITATP